MNEAVQAHQQVEGLRRLPDIRGYLGTLLTTVAILLTVAFYSPAIFSTKSLALASYLDTNIYQNEALHFLDDEWRAQRASRQVKDIRWVSAKGDLRYAEVDILVPVASINPVSMPPNRREAYLVKERVVLRSTGIGWGLEYFSNDTTAASMGEAEGHTLAAAPSLAQGFWRDLILMSWAGETLRFFVFPILLAYCLLYPRRTPERIPAALAALAISASPFLVIM